MKYLIKFGGISAFILIVVFNLHYAALNYGVETNTLGMPVLAQASTGGGTSGGDDSGGGSGTDNDPWIYELPDDVDTGGDESGGGTDASGELQGYELIRVRCLKVGTNIVYPIRESTLTLSLGYRYKCKPKAGAVCATVSQTSCS